MVNYKKLYFRLFNAITDAVEILQKAQIDAEEAYMDAKDETDESKIKQLKVYSSNNTDK